MTRPLAEYSTIIFASDVHDYRWGHIVHDFLLPVCPFPSIDWVFANPPFSLAEQFILRSIDIARIGCAMLVRTSFLESVGRYDRLFHVKPPTIVAQFVERVPMVKGRYDPKASTATSYCWLVWIKSMPGNCRFTWIPPCRAQLERASDQ